MRGKEDPRLIARVARLYYEEGVKQNEIAEKLGLSQAAVSRLLAQGQKDGIIKVVVNIPRGVYTEIEEKLVEKYGQVHSEYFRDVSFCKYCIGRDRQHEPFEPVVCQRKCLI